MHPALKKCAAAFTLKEMTRRKEFMGMALFNAFMVLVYFFQATQPANGSAYGYWISAASFFALSIVWVVKWAKLQKTLREKNGASPALRNRQ